MATLLCLHDGGNTGSIIANSLLSKGEKVRVVGRDAGRLQRFVRQGAEAFTNDMSDAIALTKAFNDVRAAYSMLPPLNSREQQERQSDAIAKAVKDSGPRYAVRGKHEIGVTESRKLREFWKLKLSSIFSFSYASCPNCDD